MARYHTPKLFGVDDARDLCVFDEVQGNTCHVIIQKPHFNQRIHPPSNHPMTQVYRPVFPSIPSNILDRIRTAAGLRMIWILAITTDNPIITHLDPFYIQTRDYQQMALVQLGLILGFDNTFVVYQLIANHRNMPRFVAIPRLSTNALPMDFGWFVPTHRIHP
jgi:hypothetical protein